MDAFHKPVMVGEVVASLRCRAGTVYVDGTVGGGGHAAAILENTAPDGLLIGIDADGDAIREAGIRLAPFGDRKILMKGNFADMDTILAGMNIGKVDGILLDLGVSSHQLDTADRGFSFTLDAPLDMRMDRSRGISACDLIHTLSADELERIIREYGEERMAGRIAGAIAVNRNLFPLRTTADLAGVAPTKRTGKDPSGHENLPGPPDRSQRRACQSVPGYSFRGGAAQRGRAFFGHLFSLSGRPDSQERLPRRRKGLPLSAGSSRLCLRPKADPEGPY